MNSIAETELPAVPIRFEQRLVDQSRDRSQPKRERTRFLFLSAIAEQLQFHSHAKLSVELILDETGLSRGTFYNYFRDLDDAIFAVLKAFLESWLAGRHDTKKKAGHEAIVETNLFYCRSYEENAGLFAAIAYFSPRNQDLHALRQGINDEWVSKIVHSMERRRNEQFEAEERLALEGRLRMLIAMSVETLQERFIYHDKVLCRSFPTVERLAQALSAIWQDVMKLP